jgi:cysteine-rich repeat protein
MYLKIIFLMWFLFIFSCDHDLTKANAPKISVSTNQIFFAAPEIGKVESQYSLIVSNEGSADLLIVKTKLVENNKIGEDSEFSILDEDDWNTRLLIKAGQSKKLRLIWKPLDDNQDSALLEITSNDGIVKVEINTIDLDPDILVLSTNPSLNFENDIPSLIFTQAMHGLYQKSVVEIKSNSLVPLILRDICLVDDDGNCISTYSIHDSFFLCATAEATKENCNSIPNELPVLSFDENYKFSLFFQVNDQRDSGFYGKLRIKSNASEKPDYLITLKGYGCLRDELNPICQKCGNQIIDDPQEKCDDGNFIETDGCGLNCNITETICADGDQGCPCPCAEQFICNEDTGLCELKKLEDAFIDLEIERDAFINHDMEIEDMNIQENQDMRFNIDEDMEISLDHDIVIDFSIDMMAINHPIIPYVFQQNLVQGAVIGQSRNHTIVGIFSIGSSFGQSRNHILKSNLNP